MADQQRSKQTFSTKRLATRQGPNERAGFIDAPLREALEEETGPYHGTRWGNIPSKDVQSHGHPDGQWGQQVGGRIGGTGQNRLDQEHCEQSLH
jgi:hypothetical protein